MIDSAKEWGTSVSARASSELTRRSFLGVAGAAVVSLAAPIVQPSFAFAAAQGFGGSLIVLPEDGRRLYFQTIDSAQREIRIEICVLEDPQILEHIQAALQRGVSVRVIVDSGKYNELEAERDHLEKYLISAGGELHLSNPVFPRSFPKILLIDSDLLVYGSACLDQTTFLQYRDFATTSQDQQLLNDLDRLFENDWAYSAAPGQQPAAFNPTPPFASSSLVLCPVNGAAQLVGFYQGARETLDVYSELLGNFTLESELAAAVKRGVRVRLISPVHVNGGSKEVQERQIASLTALSAGGVEVHVNGRQSVPLPYLHARAAIRDSQRAYLGSISLSPDAVTFNREMSLILEGEALVQQLQAQFESDYQFVTRNF